MQISMLACLFGRHARPDERELGRNLTVTYFPESWHVQRAKELRLILSSPLYDKYQTKRTSPFYTKSNSTKICHPNWQQLLMQ